MPRVVNLVGRRFGRLVVQYKSDRITQGRGRNHWVCVCDCGNTTTCSTSHLKSGDSRSCGCLNIDSIRERSTIHGHARPGKVSKTFIAWQNMMGRCYDKKDAKYYRYGERGIFVCDSWHQFKPFLIDMGEKPDGLSLDRINNDGNYEPENCRWTTQKVQQNNRSNNKRRLDNASIIQ